MSEKRVVTVEESGLEVLAGGLLPVMIHQAGQKAQYKFVEYFTATLANDNTRLAYARAVYQFMSYCEARGLSLEQVHPVAVAGYFRDLQKRLAPSTVKQHLAAVRGLFDWFVTEGVTSFNPASSVRGPKYAPREGKTPILTPEETGQLFASINGTTIKDYRDRAILGVLFYAWVRVTAVVKMTVGDFYKIGERYSFRFYEKGGKTASIPAHHQASDYLLAYLTVAGIDREDKSQKKDPLFRTINRQRKLSDERIDRTAIFRMVRDRAKAAGISTEITPHSGRGTGITAYLESGGKLETAQKIAMHADSRTTKIYDRRNQRIERADIERVQY